MREINMFNDERDLVNIIASLKVFKTKMKYIEDNLFERHSSTNQGIIAKIDSLQNQTYHFYYVLNLL